MHPSVATYERISQKAQNLNGVATGYNNKFKISMRIRITLVNMIFAV